EPLVLDDHTGLEAIFEGTTLKGWDGDPAFWRAENGAIVGQSTEQNPVKQNTFIIWRGGEPKDFELKVEFRMNSTNSGVQIRSVQLPAGPDTGKWVMKGYQADIDFANQFTGQIYEERGRGFLAMRGQAVYVPDNGRPRVLGTLQGGTLDLREIRRFPNEPVRQNGSLYWDVLRLWHEMTQALESAADTRLTGVGVDGWGVDYALIGERGNLLENPYHYRDVRNQGMMEAVFERVSREKIDA